MFGVLVQNKVRFRDQKNTQICEDCVVGKQHRSSYKASESRASEICELIHGDVCGPMETPSLGGAKYFLLLKDDYSNYRHVYFLKNKSEVKQKIAILKTTENITGKKIKTLRTDNGLEFINREVKHLLKEHGICHQRSVVYTPQQNGRAEREMRTIVEAARTMIHSTDMPKTFWAEVVNTAVFVLNKTGTSSVRGTSSIKLWHSKDVNMSIFKIFGSRIAAHVPKEKRLKLDAKSTEEIFVGYGDNVKGYRIYFPHNKKVEILKDVIFLPKKSDINGNNSIFIILEEEHNDSNEGKETDQAEAPQGNEEFNVGETIEEDRPVAEDNMDDVYGSCEEDIEQAPSYNLRDRNKLKKPSKYEDFEVGFMSIAEEDEPQTYSEAISSEDSEMWKKAIEAEMKALEENGTWVIVKKPSNCEYINSKWVFKRKRDANGDILMYKARLVAREFQQKNVSLSDIYSPVAS